MSVASLGLGFTASIMAVTGLGQARYLCAGSGQSLAVTSSFMANSL